MFSQVRITLESIGAIDPQHVELFAERTRDCEVDVFHDRNSGVIFIPDFYVGDDAYESGVGREAELSSFSDSRRFADRQLRQWNYLVEGRTILEFGCGPGLFLKQAAESAKSATAVELDAEARKSLHGEGIQCVQSIEYLTGHFDTCFMFHVLEHLPNPLEVLTEIHGVLHQYSGCLVVEVPHARDFLISEVKCKSFIDFSLWSQHLILHTRDSLRKLLFAAGFARVEVLPAQRYGLANHLEWLSSGQPGGHRGPLSLTISTRLEEEYELALAAKDASDTLVAIAWVR